MRRTIRILAIVAAVVLRVGAQSSPSPAAAAAIAQLPRPEHFKTHLLLDLLPFWANDAALGTPVGNFPSTRCDDGSAVNWDAPCPEVGGNGWLMMRQQYLVSVSRQVYGYGVAFHITGNPQYLEWMRAGVKYIRENAVDREGGGMRTQREANGEWGPRREYRNPQELAYGLLGMSFYYYLTRDPDVLQDILAIKKYIFTNYYNANLDAMQWMLASNDAARYDEKRLVAQLDQMNAYLVLLTPILPEPHRAEWKQSLEQLSRIMMKQFYSPRQNVMFLAATRPEDTDITRTGTDFGHTIKAMWMIRMAGLLTGKKDLVDFSEQNGPRVLERAYLRESGSWAEGLFQGGALDQDKSWWIYAELDQYAGSVAMTNSETAVYLPRTYDYWLTYFVDRTNGEVWNGVYDGTNLPQLGMPKSWPWKNAYHSFEHALVAYITTSQLQGRPVLLFYAFPNLPADGELRPYFYSGTVISAVPAGDPGYNTWAVLFRDVH